MGDPNWYDGTEVPWGPEPVDAALYWTSEGEGRLSFGNPKRGGKATVIRVTTGPTRGPDTGETEHVWNIVVHGDQAIVSPSIHYIGQFHSGNPATFHLVSIRP